MRARVIVRIVVMTLAISDETNEHDMGGAGKEKPPGKVDDKQGKPPPRDDDIEDGDIATPKRDRNDEDDQSR
jgi:hypothetical protein